MKARNFTRAEIEAITGDKKTRLVPWEERAYVKPSIMGEGLPGVSNLYSRKDVIAIATLLHLIEVVGLPRKMAGEIVRTLIDAETIEKHADERYIVVNYWAKLHFREVPRLAKVRRVSVLEDVYKETGKEVPATIGYTVTEEQLERLGEFFRQSETTLIVNLGNICDEVDQKIGKLNQE